MFQAKKETLVITEQDGMALSSEPLEIHEALALLEKENERLLDTNQRATCILKLYNKKQEEVFQQALSLPFDGKIEEILSRLVTAETENKEPKKGLKNPRESKSIHLSEMSIQTVTMIGFTVLTVCVLGTGFTLNHSINQANKQQIKLSQELLLSQLETSKKYDKVAQKMKEFDYPKKSIANMYVENGQFANALKVDKKALTSVLKEIDTKDNKEQKNALEALKKATVIDKEQSPVLDLRLALLNKDTDFLKKNKKSIDSQELADRIMHYFSSEKEYQEAISLLKDFPNKDLENQVKEADKSNQKKQLEAKLNDAKKAVSDTQKQLDRKNKQLSDLHKQLDDLNKNDKSPDKGKHVGDKNKEIDNANKDKNKISDILKDQQAKEKEAKKAVDNFK